ncbi:MAG: peptidylprolyl isomerase [Phycisphaerales bacterium]|nr:peptidylprolyl isomerase [Phycisphaerales bacterium]MCB9854314.1 peptidylprolyl isomerase [Phycisphaerales bacterium]MCB9863515.1 peptidylprolyl isomerase [Phycisphaerales bacterium]
MNRANVLVTALAALGVCSTVLAGPDSKEEKPKIPDRVYIKMTTSMGDIYLELNQEKAPISTENFVSYVKDGYYDGTIFHRVMSTFMIQGGGFDKDMKQKETKSPIKNEWQNGLKNSRGTIAMARTSAPDSATSQFFINVVDNPALDQPRGGAAYAVFGKVIAGMDVVDKIKEVRVGNGQDAAGNKHQNVPVEKVMIEKVTITDADTAAKAAKAAEGKDFADAMAVVKSNGGDPEKGVKTDSGLWYTDVKVGAGPTPPNASSTVKVHYTGWLVNGKKFDSSRDRDQAAEFPLNRVIRGWTEGVGSMKVGTRRILVIPYQLAYGESGRPPTIPPKATLVFDVELLEIK